MTPTFSLHAYAELRDALARLDGTQLILPGEGQDLEIQGGEGDRAARNRLQTRWLANQCAAWLGQVELRRAPGRCRRARLYCATRRTPEQVMLGSFGGHEHGRLGLTPGNPLSLTQASESAAEAAMLAQWFDQQWKTLPSALSRPTPRARPCSTNFKSIGEHRAPFAIYALMLNHLFGNERMRWTKSASSSRPPASATRWSGRSCSSSSGMAWSAPSTSWRALAAASSRTAWASVNLRGAGRHQNTTSCATTACGPGPKRLRDNWTLYKANDKRNILAADRFNYDVVEPHRPVRDGGPRPDIDLSHVNWGNYDLVVIDESHNFRNKKSPGKGPRSATTARCARSSGRRQDPRADVVGHPVNNRLTDLRTRSPSPPKATTRRWPTTASTASSRPPARRRSSSTAG